ncbi:MAG TPA: sugar-binding protein, partial [Opitutaceae bacterium]
MRLQMRRYRELFKKYGGEKPIWSTEIGSKSQGLPRDIIARDLVRKAVCFFADGGGFFTWFAVGGMPDPNGERTGSYSDSMDLFAAKYNMHLPRLDAVAFYHLINTLAAKKFVAETAYPAGEHGFLFRDTLGNALFVFWTEAGERDVFVPLPGVHEVDLTWMSGATRRLDARGKGVSLRLGPDPVFVRFRGDATPLPAGLGAPETLALVSVPAALPQGETAEVVLRVTDNRIPQLTGPASWKIDEPVETATAGGARRLAYRITVPAATRARVATFTVSDETITAPGDTELRFAVPVKSKIELALMPVAGAREGEAAIRLRLENRSENPQPVTWKVEIIDELPMENGTYRLSDAKPSTAYFNGVAREALTLAPREAKEIALRMSGTDRQTLYRLRATASDATGNTVQRERRVGGFARVVRATAAPNLDGNLDEPVWRATPAYRLDEFRQFCVVEKDAKAWAGPEDLSGALRFAWDDENLYIAVEVTDDIFTNPGADSRLWRQDGLQFLFDPFRSEVQSRGRYDYALGLGQKGLQAWCHMSADPSAPAGAAPQIRFAVTPASTGRGDRVYEVAIPWTRLAPFQPAVGADLGATMVLNEDDGAGRKSTMGWFGGVHLKETSFVGDLILEK